jgi:hypothetical protein
MADMATTPGVYDACIDLLVELIVTPRVSAAAVAAAGVTHSRPFSSLAPHAMYYSHE